MRAGAGRRHAAERSGMPRRIQAPQLAMRVAFRTDASLQIGNGHVMRCLTLAEMLRKHGAHCHFICREHAGNLMDLVRERGFDVSALDAVEPMPSATPAESAYAAWLGIDWHVDAEATRDVCRLLHPDWLIVDHYAIDRSWEGALRPVCARLMVIDDLADRPHDCDLLLDQNLGRTAADYEGLLPAKCKAMLGSRYALLRPEFSESREYSLQRRDPSDLRRILITMGGVDPENATGRVLDTLGRSRLPPDFRATVAMGPHAVWIEEVEAQAKRMPWPCEVRVGAGDMAKLMADSDLAIGAAGGTSWERCAMGLPAIVIVLADNQVPNAAALARGGAALAIGGPDAIAEALPRLVPELTGTELLRMSRNAAALCDGHGADRVMNAMVVHGCHVRAMRENDLDDVLRWRNHPE
ncbi:MAG TPA: UDP-2,4-diacetamido-2,4,6-trideoxy-beta-L-altropyranose hydrolase, partial [Xanthomonadaceae bacterium]|nr:UDP-2,4-diacetamido-2,4,6-trideoxy-beta-L-altropyranose hydrolase [Xanthomonadaceae bacterium]